MTSSVESLGTGRASRYPEPVADGVLLFSYGTLQNREVQLDLFGRRLEGEDDFLPGYTVDYAEISDARILDMFGVSVHPLVRATGNPLDKVHGVALHVTEAELDAADEFELPMYRRVEVQLVSGHRAWTYVGAPEAGGGD